MSFLFWSLWSAASRRGEMVCVTRSRSKTRVGVFKPAMAGSNLGLLAPHVTLPSAHPPALGQVSGGSQRLVSDRLGDLPMGKRQTSRP
jgi:hypothetical protein